MSEEIEVFTPNTVGELVDHMKSVGLSEAEAKAQIEAEHPGTFATPEQQAIEEAQAERAAEAAELTSIEAAPDFEPFEPAQRASIGRVVHVFDRVEDKFRCRMAHVAFVNSDGYTINADIVNHDGTHGVAIGVPLKGHEFGEPLGWDWPARV